MNPAWFAAIAAGIAALASLIRAIWEPTRLEVAHIALPGCSPLPEEQKEDGQTDTLRLVLLTDLHIDRMRIPEKRLMTALERLQPDLVLFGGDLSGREKCEPDAAGLLGRIMGLPNLSKVPLVAVPGNHDSGDGLGLLQQSGARVLRNQVYVHQVRGQSWQIIGLDDRRQGTLDTARACQEARKTGVAPQHSLVLVHNPDSLLDLPPGQAAWFCGGHFHGGQIWMPFRLEYHVLRDEKLPRAGFDKGCITLGDMTGYISRGLGCVLFPLRFCSLPEVVSLEIHSPKT